MNRCNTPMLADGRMTYWNRKTAQEGKNYWRERKVSSCHASDSFPLNSGPSKGQHLSRDF